MKARKLRLVLCALLALLLTSGSAVAHGPPGSSATSVVRLIDRDLFVAAPTFSAATRTGLVNEQITISLRARTRKLLVVSASDFILSAQGDVFGVNTWSGARRRLTVAPGQSLMLRLNFDLPRAAASEASLFYRPAGSAAIVIRGRPGGARAASPAGQPTINTFSTNGVGEPWGTAIDSAGNVWFAEPGCDFAPTCSSSTPPGQIGELNAVSHSVVLYTLPNITGNQPIFLAFDGSGNLWFTTPDNSMIGEFTPATGKFVGQWPVTPGSGPWDLTFAGGRIWYTEHLVSAIGSFDPSTHAYQDFPTISANANPYGIAANGNLIWFTENNSSVDRVAVLNTAHHNAISEYPIVQPLSGTPHLLVIDPTGAPWWSEGWSDTIATLNPALATPGQCGTTSGTCTGVRRFAAPAPATCSTSGTHTSGIAFQASSGLVWFDNSLTAQIGALDPTSSAFTMTSLSSCGPHPHDGLGLDGAGNVWFDEEFANALGELIPPAAASGAPAVITGSTGTITTTSATINGTVNPNGQATTYHFDYGTSTGYGSQAPAPPDPSAGAGTTSQSVSASLTGLSPGTTYHYRLEATNASGTTYGSDGTFVTASSSVPTITSFAPTSGTPGTAVTVKGTNLTGATAVTFNGTPATYTVVSATQIDTTVPAAASTGSISVSTPAGTATSASSFTVIAAGAAIAADGFNRTVSGGWGTADVGGPWSLLDTQPVWSVAPGAGTVSVPAYGQGRAVLSGVAVQDVDLLAKLVLPLCSGSTNCDSYLVGRFTGASNPSYYRIGAVQGQGRSTVYLRAQRGDGSNLSGDLNTGIPAAAGVAVWVRVEFQGVNPTAIRARIWPAGSAEPSTWLLNMTDTASAEQVTGAIGVRARNEDGAGARAFQFEDFQATALP